MIPNLLLIYQKNGSWQHGKRRPAIRSTAYDLPTINRQNIVVVFIVVGADDKKHREQYEKVNYVIGTWCSSTMSFVQGSITCIVAEVKGRTREFHSWVSRRAAESEWTGHWPHPLHLFLCYSPPSQFGCMYAFYTQLFIQKVLCLIRPWATVAGVLMVDHRLRCNPIRVWQVYNLIQIWGPFHERS